MCVLKYSAIEDAYNDTRYFVRRPSKILCAMPNNANRYNFIEKYSTLQ